MSTELLESKQDIPHAERPYPLRVEGVHFGGPTAESANDWSSMKVLLRRIADYLDEHPEIEDPEIHDLTFTTVFDEEDNWHVTACLYLTADKGGGRLPSPRTPAAPHKG